MLEIVPKKDRILIRAWIKYSGVCIVPNTMYLLIVVFYILNNIIFFEQNFMNQFQF